MVIWVKVGSEAKAGDPKDVLPAANWILALVPSVHRRSRACIAMVANLHPMSRERDGFEDACLAKR